MNPAFRIVVLVALVLFGLATCAGQSTGSKSSWRFASVHPTLRAKVPGTDAATFAKLVDKAKAGCPVSKVPRADVSLDASLVT